MPAAVCFAAQPNASSGSSSSSSRLLATTTNLEPQPASLHTPPPLVGHPLEEGQQWWSHQLRCQQAESHCMHSAGQGRLQALNALGAKWALAARIQGLDTALMPISDLDEALLPLRSTGSACMQPRQSEGKAMHGKARCDFLSCSWHSC